MNDLKVDLKKLIHSKSLKDVEILLLQKKQETIFKVIKQSINCQEGTLLLTGILSSLQCNTPESTSLKLNLYESILEFIEQSRESREHAEAVTILTIQAENFPPHDIIHLIKYYLKKIDSESPFVGRWAEFFGNLLSLISKCPKVDIDGNERSGSVYFYEVISTICSYKWSALTTTTMLSIMKDLNLSKEDLKPILDKTRRVLDEVDYHSVPPIIYNYILLGQGKCPGTILELSIDYFNKQEKKLFSKFSNKNFSDAITEISNDSESIDGAGSYVELIEAQSTVILHIIHLAQNDPQLVHDFLKIIKGSTWLPQRIFTPINLSLSLSLSYIDCYKESIIESLKSCILKFYRQEERLRNCHWMRDVFKEELDLPFHIKTTIGNCKGGWDQVSQGLVYLSFSLLESGGGLKGDTLSVQVQQSLRLVSTILPAILKKEPQLTSIVLKQLYIHIFTASSSTQYISLLSKLVKTIPLTMLDNINIIRELLEQLCFMPFSVAAPLLQAILPLLKLNMTLKDALMLILRKMLFSKQIASRQAAVEGFLQFLCHFKVLGTLPASQGSVSFSSSMSQISADVHSSFDANTNEALCLELLGVLRRCLSQQREVRSRLYSGLKNVTKMNPKISFNVLNLLYQHMCQYVNTRPYALNPINLNMIVRHQNENVILMEPIGDLLVSLLSCKLTLEQQREKNNNDDDNDDDEEILHLLNELGSLMDTLTEKFAYCDMEDLELVSVSFSIGSESGQRNIIYAQQLVAILDALMESNFYAGACSSEDKMKTVIALFKTQKKVQDLTKERVKAKKGEGSKGKDRASKGVSPGGVQFTSVLSLKFATQILEISILGGNETIETTCVNMIQNNADFQFYMLSVVEQIVGSLKSILPSDRDTLLPHLKIVSYLLFKECYVNLAVDADEGNQDQRQDKKSRQALTVFHLLITSCVKYFKDKLDAIFKCIAGKSNVSTNDRVLYAIQKRLQTMLLRILQHRDSVEWTKQASIIIQIMQIITREMDSVSGEIVDVYTWTNQVCKDHSLDTPALSEALVHLLLKTGDKCKQSIGFLIRELGREIHAKLGDIDQEVSTAMMNNYKVVTESSAHAVLSAIMSYCEDTFLNVEMTIYKFRSTLNAGLSFEENIFEKSVSGTLVTIIHTMHEILNTSLPQGSCLDDVTKVTRKLYATLTLYVRYYLDYYRIRTNPEMSGNFEKLVHFSGTLLKNNVYTMIKYISSREKGKRSQMVLTARATKESKLIPAMVFAMEEYEKLLITLSKKSGINLMLNMKASTARDFRITANIQDEEERGDDEPSSDRESEQNSDNENGDNEVMPPPKRPRKK